jgi:hypothetical protein
MSRRLVVTVLVLFIVIVGVGLVENEAQAGCIKLAGGGQYCAAWITGSNIDNQSVAGVGKICGPGGTNCVSQILAAVGGTQGTSPNCNTTNGFPLEIDNCGVQGIAFCVNHGGNANKAQGQPFTANAILEGVSSFTTCDKNGKCLGSVTLSAGSDLVVCQNPNWDLVTFTATLYKGKSAYCTTFWDMSTDPPTCANGGTVTILVELCQIDPSTVTVHGGQKVTCTQIPQ